MRELMLFDIDAYSSNEKQARINALFRIATQDFQAVVACTEALTVGTTSKEIFINHLIQLKKVMSMICRHYVISYLN